MAKLVFALNASLDGYIDHTAFAPDAVVFQHFIDDVRGLAGVLYGRRMYEVMRYWDEDHAEWDDARRAYAEAWRGRHKWVVSRTLQSVGPNATLIGGDVEQTVRELKQRLEGEIEVAGPELAGSLTGLIDEYRLYFHPHVVGGGKPFFSGPRPPLRLTASERIGENVVRLSYVPA